MHKNQAVTLPFHNSMQDKIGGIHDKSIKWHENSNFSNRWL